MFVLTIAGPVRGLPPNDPPPVVARLGHPAGLHGEPVRALAWTARGRTLISSSPRALCLWEAATGRLTRHLARATEEPTISTSLLSEHVALVSGGRLGLLDLGARDASPALLDRTELGLSLRGFAYARDGTLVAGWGDAIASIDTRGGVTSWRDATAGWALHQPLAAARRAPIVAAATARGVVVVDVEKRALVRILRLDEPGTLEARDLALSDDGSTVALVASRVTVFDVETGASRSERPEGAVEGVTPRAAFAPGGHVLALSTPAAITRVNARTGERLGVVPVAGQWPERPIAFSPDGGRLATIDVAGGIRFLALDEAAGVPEAAPCAPVDVALLGTTCAVVIGSDASLATWDLATGRVLARAAIPGTDDPTGAALADDATLGASITRDRRLAAWRPRTGRLVWSVAPPIALDAAARLAVARDGALVAVARGRSIELFDGATGKPARGLSLRAPPGADLALAFSPRGDRLLVGDAATLTLFELAAGHRLEPFRRPQHARTAADGGVLCVERGEREDRWVVLSHADAPAVVGSALAHGRARLAAGPSGRLALAAEDGIRIAFPSSGAHRVHRLPLPGFSPLALRFDATGDRLAVAGADGTVLVLDVAAIAR